MIDNHRFEKILGHNINDNVQILIGEVTSLFPHKEFLVHPLSFIEKELGETYSHNVNGIAKPSLSDYVGKTYKNIMNTIQFMVLVMTKILERLDTRYVIIF